MRKTWWLMPVIVVALSGCSSPVPNPQTPESNGSGPSENGGNGAVLKSVDGGQHYTALTAATGQNVTAKTLAETEVLSLVIDPTSTERLCLGTRENGIFITDNSGEEWRKLEYPPLKVYGLALDPTNSDNIYASGEWQESGQIYRSDDGGEKWERIYTEPATGTVVTALAHHPVRSGVIYAGLNTGVLIGSTDAGMTWANVDIQPDNGVTIPSSSSNAAILAIAYDLGQLDTFYVNVNKEGLFRTQDGGAHFTRLNVVDSREKNGFASSSRPVTTLALDPSRSGVLYAASENELFRSTDSGNTWQTLNIIASSQQYPIRAIAVNPKNGDELIYSAALALYKTIDGGARWQTIALNAVNPAGVIRYDTANPATLYVGTRSFGTQ